MSWSNEEIVLIVSLAKEGYSSSQIAAALPNRKTRNAVIGKLMRMGVQLQRKGHRRSSKVRVENQRKNLINRIVLKQTVNNQRPYINSETNLICKGVDFIDLKPHNCRWPHGEKKIIYCGRQKYPGSSYCLDHWWIAYRRKEKVEEKDEA